MGNNPLTVSGLVAYPADLLGGGLENWGLVAVVTSALLFDPDVSTDSAEEIVSRTVTHELAHQVWVDMGNYRLIYHHFYLNHYQAQSPIICNL